MSGVLVGADDRGFSGGDQNDPQAERQHQTVQPARPHQELSRPPERDKNRQGGQNEEREPRVPRAPELGAGDERQREFDRALRQLREPIRRIPARLSA